MGRKLKHICVRAEIEAASVDGEKVNTLCGKRIYPMPHIKPSVPTCTPCSRAVLDKYNEKLDMSDGWYITRWDAS